MQLGVQGMNVRGAIGPAETARLARKAEELGYTSWWASDHLVVPNPLRPDSPTMDPTDPLMEPLIHLTYVAAVTERIELGTGVVILPQRHPVVLAKQAASLDVLSGGRLRLGVGVGYLEPELNAVGVTLAERARRTDEYLDAMTALWTQEVPAFHGEFVSFANVDAYPRPVRPGGVPIVVGGHSGGAFRRAITRGHGWYGIGTPDQIAGHLDNIRKAAQEVERPARLGELEITVVNPDGLDADQVRRYEDLGVHRLVVYPPDSVDAERFLTENAELPH